MTTPHKWANVIKAWADGKTLQYTRLGWGEWKDYSGPNQHINGPWDSSAFQWRIKPKTVKYRRYLWRAQTGVLVGTVTQYSKEDEYSSYECHSAFIRWIDDTWQEEDV